LREARRKKNMTVTAQMGGWRWDSLFMTREITKSPGHLASITTAEKKTEKVPVAEKNGNENNNTYPNVWSNDKINGQKPSKVSVDIEEKTKPTYQKIDLTGFSNNSQRVPENAGWLGGLGRTNQSDAAVLKKGTDSGHCPEKQGKRGGA